jgi:hypothetical protein
MKRLLQRTRRDERGAALILAIAFMIVIGAIGGAVLSTVSSGVNSRNSLDNLRNREYAADGGIDFAIAEVRKLTTGDGVGIVACAPAAGYFAPPALNGIAVRVDCQNSPTVTRGSIVGGVPQAPIFERNVIFSACPFSTSQPCTNANTIVRAQVNFHASGTPLVISGTTVQSWSVNQ